MEVDTYSDEADHCTYMFCSIIQEDCSVPQSDVITATVGFDGLGAICAAESQSLLPSHHPYASFEERYPVHEDNALPYADSHNVVVQDVVEEEVNVNARADIDDNARYYEIFNSDCGKINNSSETIKSYIECAQNVVVSCCYECSRKFTKLRILKGHVKRQHGTMCDMSRVTEEILPVATVCRQCGYVGTTQQATQIHVVQKHHLPVARSSRQCKTNAQRLKLNRQRMAAQKAAYPPIVCLICRTEIGLLKNYEGHVKRYHQNDSRFGEALDDVRRIQFERTRTGDGIVLTCEMCGETHDANKLIAHIRWKHRNDVNVKQLIINARQLIHSSKQQHVVSTRCVIVSCPHCGRRLRQISLANHIKFYCSAVESAGSAASSARCYVECTICGQSMPRPKLFRHRRLVHHIGTYKQIETFMCEYCPREFTEAHQLRTHVKKHTGIMLVCAVVVISLFIFISALMSSCT